ncbi:MAG: pilus assembly protein N-terminal domain-containing protein, partial [Candidatus Omnitrophica bacterium]|nr:pilus assembly protein N-terminal domain-containing protein [Candidatus Omnitrophota bacterium]
MKFQKLSEFIKFVIRLLVIIWLLVLGNGNMGYTADIGEELKLYPGEVKIISVNNPTRIAIGNPEIADVIRVTKNEITLSPKNVGTT